MRRATSYRDALVEGLYKLGDAGQDFAKTSSALKTQAAQTRAATAAAEGQEMQNKTAALGMKKTLEQKQLLEGMETAGAATPETLEGQGPENAVDFQDQKRARSADREAQFLNRQNEGNKAWKPVTGQQLLRMQDQGGLDRNKADQAAILEEEKLKRGEARAIEKHGSDLKTDAASRLESSSRIRLNTANATKAETEAKEGPKAKPPTADQSKVATFGRRVEQAMGEMSRLSDGGFQRESLGSGIDAGAGGVPVLGNSLQSKEMQQQNQAERNFVNAVLRRESGAVISEQEFASAEKQYFPRLGDKPDVIEQKARNRQQVLQGFQAESGSAWERLEPVGVPKSGGADRKSLAQQALNDPDATEAEKAQARKILGQ